MLFVAYLHKLAYSTFSIKSTLSALGHLHELAGVKDNTKHFVVSKALLGARKMFPALDTRLPIISEVLKERVSALPVMMPSCGEAAMLQAMLVTAFYGFLHIGEIAASSPQQLCSVLQTGDLNWQADRTQVVITIRQK